MVEGCVVECFNQPTNQPTNQVKSSQVNKSSQVKSSQVKSSQVKSSQVKSSQVKLWKKELYSLLLLFIASLFTSPLFADANELAARALSNQMLQQIGLNQDVTTSVKLKTVNDYFNRLQGVSDQNQWQRADYWSTPAELLQRGAGDCEDFAIAKYLTLIRLGVAEDQLRILYVNRVLPQDKQEAHMVLLYQNGADALVLDNLNKAIQPLVKRTDLSPVYLFNSEKMWLWSGRSEPLYYGNPLLLAGWREMLSRLSEEVKS